MTVDANALVLHQYEVSPFSEKVRVVLGAKGLVWHACNQPVIMPKPEMVRLTGGYRRIPVLQVGADLWFDSLYIIEELERRFPEPSVFCGSGAGVAQAFARWSDGDLFMGIVGLLFGDDWAVDEAFLKDRSELMGAPFDPAQMAAAAPVLAAQLRRHFALLERQLADGRDFLMGARPDAIDAAVYCQIAFVRWGKGKAAALLDAFPGLVAWAARVALLGHGQRGADVARDEAIALAKACEPMPIARVGDGEFAPGDAVRFRFQDANTPLLEGELVRIDLRGLTLRPSGSAVRPDTGALHLHMPHDIGALSRAQ